MLKMAEFGSEKAKKLAMDYDRQPCGKRHSIKLEKLSYDTARFSMEVRLADCVIDRDGTCMVQGGVIPIVVDFAGVYLARMRARSECITPLARLEEEYRGKFILGKDLRIVAHALIAAIEGRKISVDVMVENERGEFKGKAHLLFIERKEDC
jgi:acyl-coenzyme A thioesterase PaaI-like protein